MLRGLRGQALYVDPKSKVLMVHSAVGPIGAGMGEMVALWTGVVKSRAHLHSTL